MAFGHVTRKPSPAGRFLRGTRRLKSNEKSKERTVSDPDFEKIKESNVHPFTKP